MTLIEAAKLALEALDAYSWEQVNAARASLLTAIAGAEKQEPNYYGLTNDHLWMSVSKEQYGKLKPAFRMACYTHLPAAQPEQEPVWDASAPIVMTPHPAFAKRQWVGLTDEQINQYDYQYRDLLYDVEKMLRENNNAA